MNHPCAAQAPWLLAAGLNRPPGPPPDDRFRVFARSCLRGAALDGDAEWTWGHNVRAVAARAVRAETNDSAARSPEVCAAWVDFFYAPAAAWPELARLAAGPFRDTHHEVGVPTALRLIARGAPSLAPRWLDCWGCAQGWARDPRVVAAHGCGHRLDLALEPVRHAYQALLDDQRPAKADGALEAAIAALDADLGGWDGTARYWLDTHKDQWTSGCCELPGPAQTACACAARDPPAERRARTDRRFGTLPNARRIRAASADVWTSRALSSRSARVEKRLRRAHVDSSSAQAETPPGLADPPNCDRPDVVRSAMAGAGG